MISAMTWVVGSLAIVSLFAILAAAFGIAAGLQSDLTAGVEGRPALYWLIAGSFGLLTSLQWPELVSWFVNLELPAWQRELLEKDKSEFERLRAGRPIIAAARSIEPRERGRFARGILGYGLFYVVSSVPIPLMFGIGSMGFSPFQRYEAVPLAVAFWVPALWTATLVVRARTKARRASTRAK